MKSNIAFIDKEMERAGQYSTKTRAKEHSNTFIGRRHKIVIAICYRMFRNDVIEYRCYTPVLQA